MATLHSPGWNTQVWVGDGQARLFALLANSIRHPSRSWHPAPAMRDASWGCAPSTANRTLHRLAALGLIGLQAQRGTKGFVRFTLGVRRFMFRAPNRKRLGSLIAPSQVAHARIRILEPGEVSPALRAALEEREAASAPRVMARCELCGSTEVVSLGITRLGDRYEKVLHCLDHAACEQRQKAAS